MSSHGRAQVIADKLIAAAGPDVLVTFDPRSVTPPCLLIEPPTLRFDVGCGATGEWRVIALAPGPANLDAWVSLDELVAVAAVALPVERAEFVQYQLSPDNPPLPAYRVTFTEGVEVP